MTAPADVAAALPLPEPPLWVKAYALGERIDIGGLDAGHLGGDHAIVPLEHRGMGIVFRYGVIVLVGAETANAESFRQKIQGRVRGPFEHTESELVEVEIDPSKQEGASGDVVTLKELDEPRIELVADVLAKSVLLAHHEVSIEESFQPMENLAADLSKTGRGARRAGPLLRRLGKALTVEHQMLWRASALDKPDLLWDRPDLDRLHGRLVEEYELVERQRVLERKLDAVRRTAEVVLELLRHQRSLRVEWYIVLLIVVEIVLMLTGI